MATVHLDKRYLSFAGTDLELIAHILNRIVKMDIFSILTVNLRPVKRSQVSNFKLNGDGLGIQPHLGNWIRLMC